MEISNKITEQGIVLPNKTTGTFKTICPKCSEGRKKKTDKCLTFSFDKNRFNCSHYGEYSGAIFKQAKKEMKEEYQIPSKINNTKLSDAVLKIFEERGIRQQVLNELQVTQSTEWMPPTKEIEAGKRGVINFNYFRDEQIVNVKYRCRNKSFKLHKGAELIFYNLDVVKQNKEIYIVEGEMDVLAMYQAGIKNVVSVPNGAAGKNNNLAYVDNCIEDFQDVEKIIIATDNDTPGRNLREQLSIRFGVSRCCFIEWTKGKDANDILIDCGALELESEAKDFKEFPLEGSFTMSDFEDEVEDLYVNGLDCGVGCGIPKFDNNLKFVKGYLTTVTGIPGHGKSEFVDSICLGLFKNHKWKTAFYSPENKPTKLHISKLLRKYTGKGFGAGYKSSMSIGEKNKAMQHFNNNLWFIKPPNGFKLKNILDSVEQLVKRKGIDCFVIDAWNKLEHNYSGNETKYIGQSLDTLADFCEKNQVHCFLVAHPTKVPKENGVQQVPNLYSIAGSANFYNKTDNGITVFRRKDPDPSIPDKTEVYIQKVKFNHWGEVGQIDYDFNKVSLRYYQGVEDNQSMIEENVQRSVKITPNMDFASDLDITETSIDCPF
jgi:twinkle protein